MFSALICHIYMVIRQELILPKYPHCADILASLVKYHNIYYYKIYNYKIAIKWVVLFQNNRKDVDLGLSRLFWKEKKSPVLQSKKYGTMIDCTTLGKAGRI